MNTYYLVSMWNYQSNQKQNHLALVEAQHRYQAMLIAIGSHEKIDSKGNIIKDGFYTDWRIDMNYESYQECKNPKEIFTYMNRSGNIKSNLNEEDNSMAFF